MIPKGHPLAAVNDVFNELTFPRGRFSGRVDVLRSPGGKASDRQRCGGGHRPGQRKTSGAASPPGSTAKPPSKRILSPMEVVSSYYVHAKVVDNPGVLAQIARAFGDTTGSASARSFKKGGAPGPREPRLCHT